MTRLLLIAAILILTAHAAPPGRGQGERREALMRRLDSQPYPPSGPWHDVGQALGSYWMGNWETADEAIEHLKLDPDFHWRAYQLERIMFLFGKHGVHEPGRMSARAEGHAESLLWEWLERRGSRALVDPAHDWWVWGSENHHLQAWFSLWGALSLLSQDPDYATRKFADGSTVRQLKTATDAYFCRWIRNRATRGLFVECNSGYLKYSLSGFYNLVDFADDPELRRLAREFLDLFWTTWALEQFAGVRGGSRHRCYNGSGAIVSGACSEDAWYLFGVGTPNSVHPSQWCVATTSYTPPGWLSELAHDHRGLGNYTVRSRLPGRALPKPPANYAADPRAPLYVKQGVYQLDAACPSMLRETFVTPDFIIGATMLEALPRKAWTAISSQNRWDGVIFPGPDSPRIFVESAMLPRGSHYNSQWSVANQGVMLLQRLQDTNSPRLRVFFSHGMKTVERDGWVFVQLPTALAAVRTLDGTTHWEADTARDWRDPTHFRELGRWLAGSAVSGPIVLEVVPRAAYTTWEDFQTAIERNPLHRERGKLEYTSGYYKTSLTLFTDYSRSPRIDGRPVDFAAPAFSGGPLEAEFAGHSVTLKIFGHVHEFRF